MVRLPYVLFAISTLLTSVDVRAAPPSGFARVVDGDTIALGSQRVRIWGIDAPEGAQTCRTAGGAIWACGAKARMALAGLIAGRPVACRIRDRDDYGRMVASCMVGRQDIAGWLVAQGWAFDYRRYSGGAYVALERTARVARRNIWAGTIVPPWQWRIRQRRHMIGRAQPAGCLFKGNINAAGDRIVHAPGQRDYAVVRIDAVRGERWFCSLDAARAAGWRPAAR